MAAPARITKQAITTEVNEFITNINRARTLYGNIVRAGYTLVPGTTNPTPLSNVDKRDAAQFIFFEIAAKFEDFAKSMFQAEVRSKLKVTATRSEYIMGDLDNGLNNKLGWGSPPRLKDRGHNLFGSNGFFGSLVHNLTEPVYNKLIAAHTVRNRVAHDGGSAVIKFVKLLDSSGIRPNERQGMSIGRYLCEYPTGGVNKNFHLFMDAYESFARAAETALP